MQPNQAYDLNQDQLQISTPLAAILALTELIEESTGESQPARMAVKQ